VAAAAAAGRRAGGVRFVLLDRFAAERAAVLLSRRDTARAAGMRAMLIGGHG